MRMYAIIIMQAIIITEMERQMEKIRKRSKKRDAILACICGTDCHPSAEWVYTQLKPQIPDLSLGTVYRNISMFREEGTIVSVGVVNGLERFDGETRPHVHFICEDCGAVLDISAIEVPTELAALAEQATGGMVSDCRLTFCGRCKHCMAEEIA